MPTIAFSDADTDGCIVGETAEDYALASRDDNRRAAALLAAQARRQLELFTPDLEPALYDRTDFVEALARLVVDNPRARIRILAKDLERTVKEGHRLVELGRRLSSYVEIRRVHEDYQDDNQSFLLTDDYGLLHRHFAARFEGSFSCKAPLEVRRLRALFNEIWDRSEPDANLRRLHL
ncbi:MAG: hypothetical protein WCZ87_02300 [Thiohalobacteraceae bacterium]